MLAQHYLNTLFEPKSVAVIGASDRENSVGHFLFKNILESGYKGRLYPINTKHEIVQSVLAYKSSTNRPQYCRAVRPLRYQEHHYHHLRFCGSRSLGRSAGAKNTGDCPPVQRSCSRPQLSRDYSPRTGSQRNLLACQCQCWQSGTGFAVWSDLLCCS